MIRQLSPCYLGTFTHTWKTSTACKRGGEGGSRPTFNDERVLPVSSYCCSVTTLYSLPSPLPTTTTLPGSDRVEALPHHPPLLILASSLQVVAVRGLEVGWQLDLLAAAVAKLGVGVHRLLLGTVRLVGEVVGGREIWL